MKPAWAEPLEVTGTLESEQQLIGPNKMTTPILSMPEVCYIILPYSQEPMGSKVCGQTQSPDTKGSGRSEGSHTLH